MKPIGIFSLAAAGLLVPFFDLTPQQMRSIDNFLQHQVDDHQTPSVQYVIFDSEATIYESTKGLSDIERARAVERSTTYHLFSVTKTFTALAILQLAEAGKIELDKPVSDYLTQFPYPHSITVRQLLTHTSGIPNPLPLKWVHLPHDHPQFDSDLFFSAIFKNNPRPSFEPGKGCRYSNLGYVFLGQLIEKVAGQSFESYVAENVLAKCGSSGHELSFELNATTDATGYQKRLSFANFLLSFLIDKKQLMGKAYGRWIPFNPFYINGTAYGGMTGSSAGLIKYVRALLPPNNALLSPEFKKLLLTETMVGGKPTGMSMAWFTGTLKGHRYLAHAGGGGGYYVELRIYPDLGVGSIIMYNRSGLSDERMLDQTDSFFITQRHSTHSTTVS